MEPRAFHPDGLMNFDLQHRGSYKNFETGGTTGNSTLVIISPEDWNARAQNIARPLIYDLGNGIVLEDRVTGFSGYNPAHVTGPIYQDGLAHLGWQLYQRSTTKTNMDEILVDMVLFCKEINPNGILFPPEDQTNKTRKGATLDEFLKVAAKSGYNPKWDIVLHSSMPMTPELYDTLVAMGVKHIHSEWGSTEECPTAASCKYHPFAWHLNYGPNLVVLAKHTNSGFSGIADEGERGYELVTSTAAVDNNGNILIPTGPIYINFFTSTEAELTYTSDKCECGRYDLLSNPTRVIDYGKGLNGCQVG